MHTVLRFLVRLILLATGLVFAAGLALLFVVLLVLAGLRTGWARLSGRPVTPFVFRVDPRAGFGRFYRAGPQRGFPRQASPDAPSTPPRPSRVLQRPADVSDVEPRRPAP